MFGKNSWLGVQLILITVFFLLCVIGLIKNAKNTIKAKKSGNKELFKYGIIPVVSLFIMLLSWVFNFGIIHFAMMITLIPFIHTAAFLFGNIFVYNYLEDSTFLKILCLISSVAYIVFYAFIPDGTGSGYMYACFGLIKNYSFIKCSQYISGAGFAVSALCIITQFVAAIKLKKGGKNEKHR